MTESAFLDLAMRAVWVTMLVAAPALVATLVTGLIVSIFQAATQINEQTLTFIPKILVMTVVLIFTAPWIVQTMMKFTIELFNGVAQVKL